MLTDGLPVVMIPDRPAPLIRHRSPWVPMALVAIVGLIARWWLASSAVGFVNGDEAMSGVTAFDVLHGQPHLLIGASNYGGTIEALVLAPLLRAFGAHVWVLRLVAIGLFGLAVLATGWAARIVLDRRLSWVAGGFVWLASGAIVVLTMTAYLGYNSGLLFTALALGLLMRSAVRDLPRRQFFAAGLCAGLAVWGHPLFIVPLLPAIVTTMVLRRHDVRRWIVSLAAGAVIGLSPLLVWNARNGWASLLHNPAPLKATTYRERLEIVVAQLLPRAFGLRGEAGDWLYPRRLGMVALGILLVLIHVGLVVLAKRSRAGVVIAAAGLFAIPLVAAFPALFWSQDARYAIVVLVPWFIGLTEWFDLALRRARSAALIAAALLVLFGALSTGKWIHRYARNRVDTNASSLQVVRALEARGIRGVTGRYWDVYRIAFFSNDRIAAHVPPEIEGPDRSTRSADQVAALPANQVAYVNYLPASATGYIKQSVGGMDLYLPG